MGKDKTIYVFFSKIAQTRDQLTSIGVAVDDDDLVQTAVDGLPDSWETFLSLVNEREVQPNFERLWHDCLEEEGRLKSRNEHHEGFVIHGKETHVCKLKKALYGLKQDSRAWYGRIDSFLQSLGFSKSIADPNLYIKIVQNNPVILVFYVDDLFLTGEEPLIA
jgi:hypothetical protein